MPMLFDVLSRFFWLILLGIAFFHYHRAREKLVAATPGGLSDDASSLLKRFAIIAHLPIMFMGVGQLLGYTPTVWYYFRPQDGNPFVLAWLVLMFVNAFVYAWWVLFAGGAQKVLELKLLRVFGRTTFLSGYVWSIKLFAVLGILFLSVWVFFVASANVPLPRM